MLFNFFFFFNDTATTEIYTLSLHDALPIYPLSQKFWVRGRYRGPSLADCRRSATWATKKIGTGSAAKHEARTAFLEQWLVDRKSTRLNSSHLVISYAVFCLKKKNYKYHSYQ